MMNVNTLREQLFSMRDEKYRAFHSKLIPNINPDLIIGIRTPILREFARRFANSADASDFLNALPHRYYEENNLHAFLIEQIGDFDDTVRALDKFLPYVDNWATCDSMRPAVFCKNKSRLLKKTGEWISSEHVYTVRYAIEMLMCHFLDSDFRSEYADMVAAIQSNEYYINMMIAWYFATALAKQYGTILPIIEQRRLSQWVHNKAIQKAIESRRISNEQKVYLRTLKY